MSEAVRATECTRHGLPWQPTGDWYQPYYVARCSHYGRRFVVDIRNAESGFVIVDYVEDLPDGDVLVEAHSPASEDVGTCWDRLVARMLADDPPQPES